LVVLAPGRDVLKHALHERGLSDWRGPFSF
jgi:hypothetical protein